MIVAIKMIGIFLGVLARSLAPYLRKLYPRRGVKNAFIFAIIRPIFTSYPQEEMVKDAYERARQTLP